MRVYDAYTARLLTIDYSDTTPDVTFSYKRGRMRKTVADAAGSRTLAYNAALNLDYETINSGGGGLYSKRITRKYATTGVMLGRGTGFQVGTDALPAGDYEVTYFYDTKGRFLRVQGPGLPAAAGGGAAYGYLANSDLIEKVLFKTDGTTTKATVTNTYEANRDLRTVVENVANGTTRAKYSYVYDGVARRTSVVYEGSAFGTGADEHYSWDYNDRSELIDAKRFDGTDPALPGPPVTAEDFVFAYDTIGNRDAYTVAAGTPTTYTPNNLNQYTATADPTETFGHDEDGNLTLDGNYTYDWNAENRLIYVGPPLPPATPNEGDKGNERRSR